MSIIIAIQKPEANPEPLRHGFERVATKEVEAIRGNLRHFKIQKDETSAALITAREHAQKLEDGLPELQQNAEQAQETARIALQQAQDAVGEERVLRLDLVVKQTALEKFSGELSETAQQSRRITLGTLPDTQEAIADHLSDHLHLFEEQIEAARAIRDQQQAILNKPTRSTAALEEKVLSLQRAVDQPERGIVDRYVDIFGKTLEKFWNGRSTSNAAKRAQNVRDLERVRGELHDLTQSIAQERQQAETKRDAAARDEHAITLSRDVLMARSAHRFVQDTAQAAIIQANKLRGYARIATNTHDCAIEAKDAAFENISLAEAHLRELEQKIATGREAIQALRAKAFLESQMYNAQNPQRAVIEAHAAFQFLQPLLMHWGINSTSSETERGISSHQTILAHRQIEVSPGVFSVYSQPITVDLKPALIMSKYHSFQLRMAIRAQRLSRFFQEFLFYHSTRQSVHVTKNGLTLHGPVDDVAILISLKYAKAYQGEKPIIIEADRADAERITKIAEANDITNYEVRIDQIRLVRNVWRGSAFQAAQNEVAKACRSATKREWHPSIVERMRQLATDYGYTNVKQNLIYKLCDRTDAVGAFMNRKRTRYSYMKAATVVGSEPVIVVTRPAASGAIAPSDARLERLAA